MKHRIAITFAVSLVVCAATVWYGTRTLSPVELLSGTASALDARIFWTLRLPRVLMGWCVGAVFGAAGSVFQTMFRNQLAEPSLLGVSSGASFGAALSIRLGVASGASAVFALPLSAFVGAICATALISAFAAMGGARDSRILLAGAAINAIFSSMIVMLQFTGGGSEMFRLFSWTLGGISPNGMRDAMETLPALAIALGSVALFGRELDIMTLGDDAAQTRGVQSGRVRRAMFVLLSLSLAIAVAKCGPISFLGLAAPWAARRIAGHRHVPNAITSACVGGTALVLCDAAARTFWAPADLPAGLLVSLAGAPFFVFLLLSRGRY